MKVGIKEIERGYLLELTTENNYSQSLVMAFDEIDVSGPIVALSFDGTHVAHVYYDIAQTVIDFMEQKK